MRLCKCNGLLVGLLWIAASAHAQTKSVAERLGYPADAKLLIVHADDLAVAHSVDAASFDALDKGGATTASIMVPCPWFNEVAAYAKDHPNADLGLHLTLTSEWKTYRWGPLESKDKWQAFSTLPVIYGQKQGRRFKTSRPKKRSARFARKLNARLLLEFTPAISTVIWESFLHAPTFSLRT